VWSDDSDGQPDVYFRPFNESAEPLDDATRLTENETASQAPSIRASGTGFALAWSESTSDRQSQIAFASVR
jgi:hypothetical protein